MPSGLAESRGVFVLGMHRSGTSAATRLVNLLGMPLGRSADLLSSPAPDNLKGYWESSTLMALNDELLDALGGSWSDPPEPPPDWTGDPRLRRPRADAQRAFARVYTSEQWVWKDPRNCITLPFWRDVLPTSAVALLVLRHPIEIAASLGVRNGFTKAFSLSLWERYTHDLLANIAGLPALFTRYESLIDDPMDWCRAVEHFLALHDLRVHAVDEAAVLEFVDTQLRSHVAPPDSVAQDPDISSAQHDLYALLRSLEGSHDEFRTPHLPSRTEWAPFLFATHRQWLHEQRHRESLQHEVNRLTFDVRALSTARAEADSQVAAQKVDVDRTRAELDHTRSALDAARIDLHATQAELDAARSQLVGTQAEFDAARQQSAEFARDMGTQVAGLQAELASVRSELVRLMSSRSFRYTAPLRAMWKPLRRLLVSSIHRNDSRNRAVGSNKKVP